MGYVIRSAWLTHVSPLGGDDYLRVVHARARARDRDEDGFTDGRGGTTEYSLLVVGSSAENLDRLFREGRRPLLIFSGRYAIRHGEDGATTHEVTVDLIGIDLEHTEP